MVPSLEEIAAIPAENLHVSRAEFAAVWAAAERLAAEQGGWYSAGVCVTCRWVAVAVVKPPTDRWYPARAPVTETESMAYAELVEAECLAAEVLSMRRPVPTWLLNQPGWIEGVVATFRWMWLRSGPRPVDVNHQGAEAAAR